MPLAVTVSLMLSLIVQISAYPHKACLCCNLVTTYFKEKLAIIKSMK